MRSTAPSDDYIIDMNQHVEVDAMVIVNEERRIGQRICEPGLK